MPNKNPGLIPTVITDVNGRVTTVHRKQSVAPSSRKMPAPTVTRGPSNASRLRDIEGVIYDYGRTMIRAKANKFVKSCTATQRAVLDEALSGFHDASQQEKDIITYALCALSEKNRNEGMIVEILALRNAFCSDWMKSNETGGFDFEALMLGLRDKGDTPMDTSDPVKNKSTEAVMRFAYELKLRAPYGGFLPTKISTRSDANYKFCYEYDRPELAQLIRDNPERVDEMIQYSLDNETCDPVAIYRLINHDGPKPLTSGYL